MKLKMLALLGALAFAAPVVAEAAPAGGMTAHQFSTVTAPPATDAAVAPGDAAPKVEKIWWRRGWGWRGGFGWRRPFFRGGYGYGWRRPFFRGYYGWRRPFWRRRWYY